MMNPYGIAVLVIIVGLIVFLLIAPPIMTLIVENKVAVSITARLKDPEFARRVQQAKAAHLEAENLAREVMPELSWSEEKLGVTVTLDKIIRQLIDKV